MSKLSIYILRLQEGKYYIGKSNNVIKRYQQHVEGTGSSWTRKYKPITLEKTVAQQSPFDEDKFVKEYMSEHGIENVRGGSYVADELSQSQLDALKAEIWGANDLCNKCGRESHFYKDCYAKSDTEGNIISQPTLSKIDIMKSAIESAVSAAVTAAVSAALKTLVDHEPAKRKVIKKQQQAKEQTKTLEQTEQEEPAQESQDICFRCGRPGHYSNGCYAKTHVSGKEI
jgi:predicted GIY-YIG superfamily endonuclease